jgi:hypothetical protein
MVNRFPKDVFFEQAAFYRRFEVRDGHWSHSSSRFTAGA